MNPQPLRRVLYPGIVLFVLVTMVLLGGITLRSTRNHIILSSIGIMEAHAQLLVNSISEELLENPEELQGYIKKLSDDTQLRITLIDDEGTVTAESNRDPATMDHHGSREEVAPALAGTPASAIRYSDSVGYDMIYYALPFGTGVLRTALPLTELTASLRSVTMHFSAALIIILIIALTALWLVISRIERPLRDLAERSERYAALDFSAPESTGSSLLEVHALSNSLDTMADSLQRQIRSIRRQRDELQAVLNSMSEAVIVLDARRRIIDANPSAQRAFAPTLECDITTVLDTQKLMDMINSTADDEVRRTGEIIHQSQVYQVSVTRLPGSRGFLVLVFNDITTLMHLERVRRDFVANVSHELKTPITSIKGFSETLLEANGEVDQARSKRFLEIIHRQTLRLQAIIDDLLTLSQLEQIDRLEEHHTPVRLVPLIQDALVICREKTRQIDRELTIEGDLQTSVRGNGHLIEQAFINLIENAMKYSEPSTPITISLSPPSQGELIITVTDKGYGIPPKDIQRIFERFYRVDKARSRTKGGTGLGLSIVRHIMLQHRGRVEVTSREGYGSSFSLHFPL